MASTQYSLLGWWFFNHPVTSAKSVSRTARRTFPSCARQASLASRKVRWSSEKRNVLAGDPNVLHCREDVVEDVVEDGVDSATGEFKGRQ